MKTVLYEFKSPYDRFAKTVTLAVVIVLSFLNIYGFYLLLVIDESNVTNLTSPSMMLVCMPLIVLIVPYLFSPRGYALTTTGVLIKRPLKNVFIPYDSIVSVRTVAEELKWGIRLWGSGGLYGFIGLFRFKKLGNVRMYVTDRGKMVLIETRCNVRYIISPSDPVTFIEKIKLQLNILHEHRY